MEFGFKIMVLLLISVNQAMVEAKSYQKWGHFYDSSRHIRAVSQSVTKTKIFAYLSFHKLIYIYM